MNAHMVKHLSQLAGKKIGGLIEDKDTSDIGEVAGFKLNDGTLVWIMRDPEGNGPGHLDIQKG